MASRNIIVTLLIITSAFAPYVVRAQSTWSDYSGAARDDWQYGRGMYHGGIMIMPPGGGSQTIMRGGIQTGGVCGFDFQASLMAHLAILRQIGPEMIAGFLLGGVMEVICQSAPSACDLWKDFRQAAQFTLRSQRATCQMAMQLGRAAGGAVANPAIAECIRTANNESGDIDAAVERCLEGTDTLPGPNGIQAPSVNVVRDMLATVGAPAGWSEYIAARVPNITAETSGTVFTTLSEASATQAEESIREEALALVDEINAAVDVLETPGGTPEPIGVPGQPIPLEALEALKHMSPEEREYYVAKLASATALAKEGWNAREAGKVITTAMSVSEMSEEQRREAQWTRDQLIANYDHLREQKKIVEENVSPVVEELMRIRAERQARADSISQQARSDESPPTFNQETGQSHFGYRQ